MSVLKYADIKHDSELVVHTLNDGRAVHKKLFIMKNRIKIPFFMEKCRVSHLKLTLDFLHTFNINDHILKKFATGVPVLV